MIRRKWNRLVIPPLVVAIFITVTATPSLASTLNPRLSGLDRYETSTAIANQFSSQTVNNVILASGSDYPDALSASVLAHQVNAPILLVDSRTQTSTDALGYIGTHLQTKGTVYIVGGQGAIGSDFDSDLTNKGYNVVRLGGVDRYATNQLTVDALNSAKGGTVFIASGENFPDVLSVSSFASKTNSPILLVKANSMSQEINDYLHSQQPNHVYISGGTGVVSGAVESQIQSILPNAAITRFAGKDRYETGSLAYKQLAMNPKTIYVASGVNYPDALSGTALAAQNGDPILLIDPSTPLVPDSIAQYLSQLHKNGISPNVTALGGSGVVPNEVVNNVVNLLNGKSQSPLFNISTVDPRLILGGSVVPLPNSNYWFNKNTYNYGYPYSSFRSSMQYNLYYYMLNLDNQVSVHNRAVALHSGITVNNCVYFQAEVLRRMGFGISQSMANVVQFSNVLPKLGFKKDTNIQNLKLGDIVITEGYTHTYTFMGWVNPEKYDYAYIVDNQARSFGGQVYHVRKVDTYDPVQGTDAMAFFMYY